MYCIEWPKLYKPFKAYRAVTDMLQMIPHILLKIDCKSWWEICGWLKSVNSSMAGNMTSQMSPQYSIMASIFWTQCLPTKL